MTTLGPSWPTLPGCWSTSTVISRPVLRIRIATAPSIRWPPCGSPRPSSRTSSETFAASPCPGSPMPQAKGVGGDCCTPFFCPRPSSRQMATGRCRGRDVGELEARARECGHRVPSGELVHSLHDLLSRWFAAIARPPAPQRIRHPHMGPELLPVLPACHRALLPAARTERDQRRTEEEESGYGTHQHAPSALDVVVVTCEQVVEQECEPQQAPICDEGGGEEDPRCQVTDLEEEGRRRRDGHDHGHDEEPAASLIDGVVHEARGDHEHRSHHCDPPGSWREFRCHATPRFQRPEPIERDGGSREHETCPDRSEERRVGKEC